MSGVLLVTGILAGCGQSKKDDHLTVYLWENRLMKNIAPYIHEQFPDQDIEFIIGNNDTDLYSYFKEHGELPDIMTVRRFSGTDAQDLQPYLMDFASYDVVSKYYSYAVEYYKDTDDEIQWLPICAIPQTIIANKTLFDQYGIKVPENYEEYVQVCQQFYDKGIKPYSMDLAEDWSNQEIIQAAAIGEFTSLDGIDWRNKAETSAGEIKFDDVLWKRIFSETSQFLKDSHLSKEDINVNVNTGTQMFVEGKSAMFHGQPRDMQKFQDQMDAELIRIPYFSQTSDSSFISLIRHNADDKEKVIEYADKIAISSQHLLGIINDVLDMSKIEAGKTVFKYSDFSILDAIEELNTIFHSQANEKNQSFIITKENLKHEWVNGDKVHLMQIFSNLLSNAIKYTQEGGIIQFIAEESETNSSTYGKYHFIVSDNGMGMSADFKETIFDAFTRAESSVTNKIQGTGLGMAITKNLVESMGGTIEVESEPNRGSSFEVILNLKIVDRTDRKA